MTCRSGQKRFWNQTRLYSFVFFMYVQILWQGQKAVLTIVKFEFFGIFYSKFQLASTFSICSKFCVKNWLLCCDLICKWVTCRSGCKRFWKSALHLWTNKCCLCLLKGHWTTSASSPIFFQKSWDFYIIRSVYLCRDCMLSLTCSFNSVTKIYAFFFQ